MSPAFSVTSARPSGRKVMAQGESKSAMIDVLNGLSAELVEFWPVALSAEQAIRTKGRAASGRRRIIVSNVDRAIDMAARMSHHE